MSRPLFFYVKKAHLGVVPGLKEYVDFFLDDQMIGPDSPLAEYGLVAAPDAEREEQRDGFRRRQDHVNQTADASRARRLRRALPEHAPVRSGSSPCR